MGNDKKDWKSFEKTLDISEEQEAEIRLEMELIEATIEARKKNNLSQRQLSGMSGIKQPAIARIESYKNSPQVSTLMKLLYSMGYTLRVVPLDELD
ncbi:MAG: helix-turn-helix domain-containing protein [Clostridia bacterium]|nr:helix-turn-helix domain-containing protein [Clostridia bacterium]